MSSAARKCRCPWGRAIVEYICLRAAATGPGQFRPMARAHARAYVLAQPWYDLDVPCAEPAPGHGTGAISPFGGALSGSTGTGGIGPDGGGVHVGCGVGLFARDRPISSSKAYIFIFIHICDIFLIGFMAKVTVVGTFFVCSKVVTIVKSGRQVTQNIIIVGSFNLETGKYAKTRI